MLKLHLGCGNVHIDGFINIDIRYLPSVDIVDNARYLRKFSDNTVDLIYASHILEHFSRWETKSVIQRWYEVLKPNGILRLAVPDFEAVCNHYMQHKDIRKVSGMLYGGQDFSENYHKWVWDFISITDELRSVGFKEVKRYNWRETEHCLVDDYSQSYLPHLDKKNGMLMSLNIEALK